MVVAYILGSILFPHDFATLEKFQELTFEVYPDTEWFFYIRRYFEILSQDSTSPRITDFFFLAFFLLSYLFFLLWVSRTNQNLTALGRREKKFSPPSIWLYGLIPLVSLVILPAILQEIWKGSHPKAGKDWKTTGRSGLVTFWAVFHALAFVGSMLLVIGGWIDLGLTLTLASVIIIGMILSAFVGVILAIILVTSTNKRQLRRLAIQDQQEPVS